VISLNGKPAQLPVEGTVIGVLHELGVSDEARGVAVAVDGEVVPRGDWGARRLRDGARVEVLNAMQGG
jgi:sulfur carrier protein